MQEALNHGSKPSEKVVYLPEKCICSVLPGGQRMGYIYATTYTDGSPIPMRLQKGGLNPDYGRAFPCACRRAEEAGLARDFLWQEANLPPGQWTFSSYLTDIPDETTAMQEARVAALDTVRAWASGQPKSTPWVFLYGPVGVGKTHLCCAAVAALVGADIHARYEYVPDLVDRLRSGQGDDSYAGTIAHLRNLQVLVLDDLNATKTTDWAEGEILKLVDWRYREHAPLLVTTNVELDQVEGRLLDRLTDRQLSSMMSMIWPSYRQRL